MATARRASPEVDAAVKRARAVVSKATDGPKRRAKLAAPVGSYFASGRDKENLEFTSTGCGVLDEALGGGPALGRCINIVGDKSSGKTLLAMEIMAQTLLRYPGAMARYAESESAWDEAYALALGIPVHQIELNPKGRRVETVEDWADDAERFLASVKAAKAPCGVYVLDSLDAISDDDEMDADFGEASFGGKKPKLVGQFFRRLVDRFAELNVLLVIISQLRDKIGVTYGETKTRSGGKALDFYATHILWLRECGKLKRTVSGVERVIGLDVEGYVKKNKVGLAFRKARYPLLFGYGIDDLTASAEWLCEIGRERLLHELGMRKKPSAARAKTRADLKDLKPEDPALTALRPYSDVIEEARNEGGARPQALRDQLTALVRLEWQRVESDTLPKAPKYG
jgi:recombination protein RecA